MIVDLPSTTTTEVSKRLVSLRQSVGAMAMGRVLTLLIETDERRADAALEVAGDATRQHPARILAVVRANRRGASRLDAQIRVGGDAGASEVVVLRLYGELADHGAAVITPLLLPDSPIVAWWPGEAPNNVATSPLGEMARRRITDAAACEKPTTQLKRRAKHYEDGDTDLSWARVTRWRGLLAAALDEPPFEPIESAVVVAEPDEPGADLMAGWLAQALGVPIERVESAPGTGIARVELRRPDGAVELTHSPEGDSTLTQPGRPQRIVTLGTPGDAECLAAELRRLDSDEVYAAALTTGLPDVIHPGAKVTKGSRAGRSAPAKTAAAPAADTERVAASPEALAADVAAAIVSVVTDAVAQRGVAHLALTGGTMGARTVSALADQDLDAETWSKVHLWWGDERFVPAGHEDRNDQQARDAGLDRLPIPADHVHSAPSGSAEEDLARAAEDYGSQLTAYTPEGRPTPHLDLVLLGVGPDAHVASLFPNRPELTITDATVVPVSDSPKPPPLRVSLTLPVINAADRVWLVVAGADKAAAVAAARAATDDPHLPASSVHGTQETLWWLDEAATGR